MNLLDFWIEEMVIPDTIRWCLVNVFHLVSILVLACVLIKILFVVNMVAVVVLAICNIRTIVPCWQVSLSWKINSIINVKKQFRNWIWWDLAGNKLCVGTYPCSNLFICLLFNILVLDFVSKLVVWSKNMVILLFNILSILFYFLP